MRKRQDVLGRKIIMSHGGRSGQASRSYMTGQAPTPKDREMIPDELISNRPAEPGENQLNRRRAQEAANTTLQAVADVTGVPTSEEIVKQVGDGIVRDPAVKDAAVEAPAAPPEAPPAVEETESAPEIKEEPAPSEPVDDVVILTDSTEQPSKEEAEEPEEGGKTRADLEAMDRKTLVSFASENGLKGSSRMKTADVIDKLVEKLQLEG